MSANLTTSSSRSPHGLCNEYLVDSFSDQINVYSGESDFVPQGFASSDEPEEANHRANHRFPSLALFFAASFFSSSRNCSAYSVMLIELAGVV